MISLLISEPFKIGLTEADKPIISGEDVLIKVKYVGFCGSDLSSYMGRNPMVRYPVVPGHEIAGVISEKGPGVPDRFKPGDKVTVIPYTSCGKCASCLRGRANACQYNETLGVQRNGAMSEFVSIPWNKVIRGNGLSFEELALTEPLTVGFHAVSRGRVAQGDTVAILGCGIIGMGALISSVNRGAKVVAVDVDGEKLEFARSLGALESINTSKQDLVSSLKSLSGGKGPDIIIEAAGQRATYQASVEGVAFTGRVVCIGYAKEDISFATRLFVQKELDILGSRNASLEDFNEVMDILGKGKLQASSLISSKVSPGEAAKALEKWVKNPGRVFKILVGF